MLIMDFDIVVVGAGPSGSTAAKTIAEQGINVLLVDKDHFPRNKPCGGGLPIRTVEKIPYLRELQSIESYSYGGYIYSVTSKNKVKIQKTEPVIAMVQRSKFDYELVQLAIEKGAVFKDNKKLIDINIQDNYANLIFNDSTTITTNIVIGSDGYQSITARKTNLAPSTIERGICILDEIPMNKEEIERFYTQDHLCYIYSKIKGIRGYGWVFPKKDHVNIGIASYNTKAQLEQKNTTLKQIYTDYLTILKENNIIPQTVQNTTMKGGLLPIQPLPKTYMDHLLLCGDAAGLINPISGEGIYYAIVSGTLAGETAAEAIRKQDTSEKFLSRYEEKWKKEFGREIKLFLRSKKQWGKQGDNMIQIMNKDPEFAELIFLIMVGKESAYDLRWKIIRRFLRNKIFP